MKNKIKTHRGAAKRFKLTKSGKVKRDHAFRSHILTKKSTKRKRGYRSTDYISKADEANVKMLIPYK